MNLKSKKLPSGLNVDVIEMPDFNQVYGLAMVDFGSIDNYLPSTKEKIPAGMAHFIEHKLFAKDGYDVSEKYSEYGANSNAYTSYTKTAYLFQCVDNYQENLEVLMDLVKNPYFTDENVAKERDIISQEIHMYNDVPEWQLESGLLGKLYPNEAISEDIAGTDESLAEINPTNMLETFKYYYHPQNMNLSIAGNVDSDEVFDFIEGHESKTTLEKEIIHTEKNKFVAASQGETITKHVSQSKILMGLKIDNNYPQNDIKLQFMLNVLFELMIGDSSAKYEELFNQKYINDSFGFNVVVERNYTFVTYGGDTENIIGLCNNIQEFLTAGNVKNILDESNLERIKKDIIGALKFSENSPEVVSNQQAELYFYQTSVNDLQDIVESISIDDVNELANNILKSENMSYYGIQKG